MDRRAFIKRTSLATAAVAAGVRKPLFAQEPPLKIGLIGSGWYGLVIAKAALQAGGVEIVAVSDVDSRHLGNGVNELQALQGKAPRGYKHHGELLAHPGLEAILIGTPPHWHALQFVDACKKGLPIYCEKPLAYDVDEGKAMVAAARRAGNIVQIGFQRRQSEAFKRAKEWIENGTTGRIHQINAQIHYTPGKMDTTIQEPPASLDWDAWCGPAPKLPYRPSIGHGPWRLEKAYGNGHLVDWGIHHIDIIRTVMGFDMPSSVHASGSLEVLKEQITTPDTLQAIWQFDDCPVIWQHRLWGVGDMDPRFNNGVFFHGEKGTLFVSDERVIWKAGRDQPEEVLEIPTPDMQEKHLAEFITAVKTGNKGLISCDVEEGFRSTAAVQLAMIAYDTSSTVGWDASGNSLVGTEEVQRLMARPYRTGYQRPAVAL